jgi:hypothetical protein
VKFTLGIAMSPLEQLPAKQDSLRRFAAQYIEEPIA